MSGGHVSHPWLLALMQGCLHWFLGCGCGRMASDDRVVRLQDDDLEHDFNQSGLMMDESYTSVCLTFTQCNVKEKMKITIIF
jgi:hypothetical protein